MVIGVIRTEESQAHLHRHLNTASIHSHGSFVR